MTKEAVLQILQQSDGYVSGQAMSQRLGVSRMAVCKAIDALRRSGYTIESVTRRGYRLCAAPEALSSVGILAALGDHPWAANLKVLEVVDSTNTYAKRLAACGAPAGTVVVANQQTGGRGRLGRSFLSPKDCGIYLSVILRPHAAPDALLHLTALAAEAMCQAVENAVGLRPGIKWTNDLVVGTKKICGILTELSMEAESSRLDSIIIGIGLNCNHRPEDFPQELRPIASSLAMELGHPVDRSRLAAEMIRQLARLDAECLTEKAEWIRRYAADCVTIGQEVQILKNGKACHAHADGIDENAALRVTYDNGETATVFFGEVSVRGMYGYV